MCGKGLLVDDPARYVVKIEVTAAYDPMELTEADLAEDKADEMHALIEQMADLSAEEARSQVHKTFRFDLCTACRKRYVKDPLLRSSRPRARFGHN
jgi:hypothetical protein